MRLKVFQDQKVKNSMALFNLYLYELWHKRFYFEYISDYSAHVLIKLVLHSKTIDR